MSEETTNPPQDATQNGNGAPVLDLKETDPIVTAHDGIFNGQTLRYKATTGMMPLKNEKGEVQAEMFYVAYTMDDTDDPAKRPLTFVFNGGPGSSSVWLHLGALGPMRVKMQDEGWMPAPPYQLVPNDFTWLDKTDLVFIDPVGTGYSRAAKEENNKQYWGLKGDIESVGEFIRLYLSRNERWLSPLFLAGESYGTTRAAGLSGHLVDKGIALNGIILISTVMNFQTLIFEQGNDLPYLVFLPTYTATAWYHKRLPDDLQAKALKDLLEEVETWVDKVYSLVLFKGDRLTPEERLDTINTLSRYTGLSPEFVDDNGLRINIFRFVKELTRDEKRSVGRLDSRFKGIDTQPAGDVFDHDPSFSAIYPPYTATFNDYVRRTLGYHTDRPFETLSFKVNMEWEPEKSKFPDTSEALRSAFAKNPFMKLMMGMGHYDLATPHYAALYTLNHMNIEPSLAENITVTDYQAGHMFYLDLNALAKFKDDFDAFLASALPGEG